MTARIRGTDVFRPDEGLDRRSALHFVVVLPDDALLRGHVDVGQGSFQELPQVCIAEIRRPSASVGPYQMLSSRRSGMPSCRNALSRSATTAPS